MKLIFFIGYKFFQKVGHIFHVFGDVVYVIFNPIYIKVSREYSTTITLFLGQKVLAIRIGVLNTYISNHIQYFQWI